MSSDPFPSIVCSDEFLRFSLRRCRCHACRQWRIAELHRALQRKFGQCRSVRPVPPPLNVQGGASPREAAAVR